MQLQGRRIVITRAKAQSAELRTLLEADGAEVLAIPAIEIAPPDSYAALDTALSALASYHWLVFTSANAVRATAARMGASGIPASLQVAVIGQATAEAALAIGLRVELVAPLAVAESLAAALAPRVRHMRVLLIRAKVARDVLPAGLTAAGAYVTIAEAYQTLLPQASVELLRAAFQKPVDAITFTSASSVANFFVLATAAGMQLPASVMAVSIGPVTTQALAEHGWSSRVEAVSATAAGLLQAVVDNASKMA